MIDERNDCFIFIRYMIPIPPSKYFNTAFLCSAVALFRMSVYY